MPRRGFLGVLASSIAAFVPRRNASMEQFAMRSSSAKANDRSQVLPRKVSGSRALLDENHLNPLSLTREELQHDLGRYSKRMGELGWMIDLLRRLNPDYSASDVFFADTTDSRDRHSPQCECARWADECSVHSICAEWRSEQSQTSTSASVRSFSSRHARL